MSLERAEHFDPTGVQAISFDLDDTFWECKPAIVHAEAVTWNWLQRNAPKVTARYTPSDLLTHRQQLAQRQPTLIADVTRLRQTSLRELLREFDYPEPLADEAFSVFYRARSEVVLFEGVHELLDALQPHYRVAAITNGNADLQLIGIDHHFEAVYHASVDLAPKPETQMFEACLAEFRLPPQALLHVGDNPQTDVGGAHNAGARAVWYNAIGMQWPVTARRAELEVGSLAELTEHLV